MSDSFRALEDLLRLTAMRHGVIALNIANADTPGYKSMDLKFRDTLTDATMQLRTTSPRHIAHSSFSPPQEVTVANGDPWADGNSVELDIEVGRMTENALLFQAGISMFGARIRMFKNALRR